MNNNVMTKADLLGQVAGLSHNANDSVEFAKLSQTDEDCRKHRELEVTKAERFEKQSAWTIGLLAFLTFIAVSVLMYTSTAVKPDANVSDFGKAFLAGWFGIMSAGAIFCLSMAVKSQATRSRGYSRKAQLLSPVTGTVYCELGLKALKEGGQAPIQWRDIALKERSQLYIFDVLIMSALAERERDRAAAHAREQACRSLHDLPSHA